MTKTSPTLGFLAFVGLCSCAYDFDSTPSASDSSTSDYSSSDSASETEEDTVPDLCPSDPAKTEPGMCGCGVDDDTCAGIVMSKATFTVSEEIVLSYSGLPGNPMDWIGLYSLGTPNEDAYFYQYANGNAKGTLRFPGLRPGDYEARLFFNDSYQLQYTTSFTVTQRDNELIVAIEADSYVDGLNLFSNFGTATLLGVDTAPVFLSSILRFSMPTLSDPIQSAQLRLVTIDESVNGPQVVLTSNAWSEDEITWNNRPAPSETIIANFAEVYYSSLHVDLPSSLLLPGTYSLYFLPDCDDGLDLMSRESAMPPYVVIVTGE